MGSGRSEQAQVLCAALVILFSSSSLCSVAVTRSKDMPSFGPPIPEGVTFPKSSVFRDFLLAKVINAENAAHKSHKFRAMATRTRQEYLRDLAERHTTSTPIDPSGKFPFISLAHKKKEKSRPYAGAEMRSLGAITWLVHAEDPGTGGEIDALLAISNDFLILLDHDAKAVVFNCATKDVIGWTLSSPASLKVFYERGESVSLRSVSNNTEDFKEVLKRLEVRTYTMGNICKLLFVLLCSVRIIHTCTSQLKHKDEKKPNPTYKSIRSMRYVLWKFYFAKTETCL